MVQSLLLSISGCGFPYLVYPFKEHRVLFIVSVEELSYSLVFIVDWLLLWLLLSLEGEAFLIYGFGRSGMYLVVLIDVSPDLKSTRRHNSSMIRRPILEG